MTKELPIITIASPKGGVGKTTIAHELAALFSAVLVDFDWDLGGATGLVGDDPEKRQRSPLLENLLSSNGPIPRPLHLPGQPAFVPSDSRLGKLQTEPEKVVAQIVRWHQAWRQSMIIDTHPGTGTLADGAMLAADVVVVPLTVEQRSIEAFVGFIRRVKETGLPLVVVLNRCHQQRNELMLFQRLYKLTSESNIPIAALIPDYPWLARRRHRAALSLIENPSSNVKEAIASYLTLTNYLTYYIKGGEK